MNEKKARKKKSKGLQNPRIIQLIVHENEGNLIAKTKTNNSNNRKLNSQIR